jgi:hypothetical protein
VQVDKTQKASVAEIEFEESEAGSMLAQDLLMWSSVVIAVGGAVGVLYKVISPLVRKTKHLLDSLSRFTVDWFGEEEAPGRDKVPGVMERLNNIDGELKHNGGSTMKDALKRVEQTQKKILERLDEGNKRFKHLEEEVALLKREEE